MNILWITNIVLPEAQVLLNGSGELKGSGGWMVGAADALLKQDDGISLSIATVSHDVSKVTCLKGDRINYWLLPFGKGNTRVNHDYEPFWRVVNEVVNPDVVHLHGSEFTHGLAYVNACGAQKVVLSIQGLRSVIKDYYFGGLSFWQVLGNTTIHDVLKGGGLIGGYRDYSILSKTEIELIQKVNHVIGRTSWDKSHTWAINPNAEYHCCNEILRPEFYVGEKWQYSQCIKHSIFLSQATNPFKGFHQMLKAMPLILKHYPDTQIRIAGFDTIRSDAKFRCLRVSGYGKILGKYIEQYNLQGHVTFTGTLSAEEMKNEYLKSNVFVMPSSIENSPNSLGEAQILGVPHVAAFVGGTSDMMVGNESNMYRFEETTMLAEKICEIFSNSSEQVDMSETALIRHNSQINSMQLLNIYKSICDK